MSNLNEKNDKGVADATLTYNYEKAPIQIFKITKMNQVIEDGIDIKVRMKEIQYIKLKGTNFDIK